MVTLNRSDISSVADTVENYMVRFRIDRPMVWNEVQQCVRRNISDKIPDTNTIRHVIRDVVTDILYP